MRRSRRRSESEQFSLPGTAGHGGARPGAGRPRVHDAEFPRHRPRPVHSPRDPVHVTIRVLPHVWNLRTQRALRPIADALDAVNKRPGFQVVHFAVMGNHLHLIVEADDRDFLSGGLRALTIRIARSLNALMGTKGRVLDGRYWARAFDSPKEARHILRYVLNNHRRHHGPGPAWWLDPFSSAIVFPGWRPLSERDEQRCRREAATTLGCFPANRHPVVPPSTWLLRVGWRQAVTTRSTARRCPARARPLARPAGRVGRPGRLEGRDGLAPGIGVDSLADGLGCQATGSWLIGQPAHTDAPRCRVPGRRGDPCTPR